MAKGTVTQGTRHDFVEGEHLEPGEYGRCLLNGEWVWYCRAPQAEGFYAGMGNLKLHAVVEHDDGTITVSPSILITGHHGHQWHGYLERGIWKEV